MKNQVFLGGTRGNNNWRDGLIERLVKRGISVERLFNPVVDDRNEETQRAEDAAKAESSFMLYYLGDLQREGNYVTLEDVLGEQINLFEVMIGLYDASKRTVVVLDAIKIYNDLKARFPEAPIFTTLDEAEDWLVKNFTD